MSLSETILINCLFSHMQNLTQKQGKKAVYLRNKKENHVTSIGYETSSKTSRIM